MKLYAVADLNNSVKLIFIIISQANNNRIMLIIVNGIVTYSFFDEMPWFLLTFDRINILFA